jgi:glycosyltransferase involved in cell wall biosynthesis
MGGFKVAYEYANALVGRGHEVTVLHPASITDGEAGASWRARSRRALSYPLHELLGTWRPTRWFRLDPRVQLRWVPSLRPEYVPDADAVLATWWRTAELLAACPARSGRKHYLIQHLETWGGPEQRVLATWRLPLVKIVIARWLEQFARQLGEDCHYVPNGLDFAAFGIDVPSAQREPFRVAMLYHDLDWKGSRDGLEALRLAQLRLPQLRAELFGTVPAPPDLPDWITYRRDPPQAQLRALYNRAAIFVAPSWVEGWPLPPAEALACGCALVCTDIGGHREYARHGETALMSPPRDPAALAHSIALLAADEQTRLGLAASGNELIRQFTWPRATEALEKILVHAQGGMHDSVPGAKDMQAR